MPVQNAEIAAMFDQTAELLEIKGDNPFRIRA
jgi:DNA polymerase (family X)